MKTVRIIEFNFLRRTLNFGKRERAYNQITNNNPLKMFTIDIYPVH